MKINFNKLQTIIIQETSKGELTLKLHNGTSKKGIYDENIIELTEVKSLTGNTSPAYSKNTRNDAAIRREIFTVATSDTPTAFYVGSSMINNTFGTYFDVAFYDNQAIVSVAFRFNNKQRYATRFSVALDFDRQIELTGTNYYSHSIKGLANISYENMTALTSKSKAKAAKATRTQLLTDLLFEIGNDINLGQDCSSELSIIKAFAIANGLIENNTTELEDLLNDIEAANEPELTPAIIELIEVNDTTTIANAVPSEAPPALERSYSTIVECLHAETGTDPSLIRERLNGLKEEAVYKDENGYRFYMQAFKQLMIEYINYDFNPTYFHHFTERLTDIRTKLSSNAYNYNN